MLCLVCYDQFAKGRAVIASTVAGRDSYYRRTYDLSARNYRTLFNEQAGLCLICRRPQESLASPLLVDHNHETGVVRGLLCSNCNAALGLLGDDPETLRRAGAYLDERGAAPTTYRMPTNENARRRIAERVVRSARRLA